MWANPPSPSAALDSGLRSSEYRQPHEPRNTCHSVRISSAYDPLTWRAWAGPGFSHPASTVLGTGAT